MAPGPHVKIEDRERISFEPDEVFNADDETLDDEPARAKYYPSEKILGKLYRTIDEQEVFRDVQYRDDEAVEADVMEDLWALVEQRLKVVRSWDFSVDWRQQEAWARDIRDA